MAQICVSNLTFCYEGSFDNIFEDVSFVIDTDWKLGFIGRNGKGKTTFLNILSESIIIREISVHLQYLIIFHIRSHSSKRNNVHQSFLQN